MAYGTNVRECAHGRPLSGSCAECQEWTAAGSPFCAWYALCGRPAVGTMSHPILKEVPCCQRCVDKHEMSDRLTRGFEKLSL